MGNLIAVFKNTQVIRLIIIINIMFSFASTAQEKNFNIDFQSGFDNDKITVLINDIEIIDNFELETNRVLGLAASIKVSQVENGKVLIESANFDKSNSILYNNIKYTEKMKLSILYQGDVFTKVFCILDGKYIGVQKDKCQSISFIQSINPFIYE